MDFHLLTRSDPGFGGGGFLTSYKVHASLLRYMKMLLQLSKEPTDIKSEIFTMAPPVRYQVYNRRQQGLAETARLILEFANESYENIFVEVKTRSPFTFAAFNLTGIELGIREKRYSSSADAGSSSAER